MVNQQQKNQKKSISRIGVYGIIVQNNQILLVTQKKGPYAGKFDLPGGGMEWGETPEHTLRRELAEEVNGTFTRCSLWENLTTTVEGEDYLLHQIGLIYHVFDFKHQEMTQLHELEYSWQKMETLTQAQLSNLAWESIKRVISLGVRLFPIIF